MMKESGFQTGQGLGKDRKVLCMQQTLWVPEEEASGPENHGQGREVDTYLGCSCSRV